MPADASITQCIALLRQGEAAAAQRIWERYYPMLVRLAHRQLAELACRQVEDEDIALSALDRFCRAARAGRYPELADRDGLWRLLLQITTRRVRDQARYERRQRRGGGQVVRESDRVPPVGVPYWDLGQAADDEPTPGFAAQVAEECRILLARLGDPDLRALAIAKMDGMSNEEIAADRGCSIRTVERRLKLIREIWREPEAT